MAVLSVPSNPPSASSTDNSGLPGLLIILGLLALVLGLPFLVLYLLRPKRPPPTRHTFSEADPARNHTLIELSNMILPPAPGEAGLNRWQHYINFGRTRFVGLSRRALAHSGVRFSFLRFLGVAPMGNVGQESVVPAHRTNDEETPLLPRPPRAVTSPF